MTWNLIASHYCIDRFENSINIRLKKFSQNHFCKTLSGVFGQTLISNKANMVNKAGTGQTNDSPHGSGYQLRNLERRGGGCFRFQASSSYLSPLFIYHFLFELTQCIDKYTNMRRCVFNSLLVGCFQGGFGQFELIIGLIGTTEFQPNHL